MGSLEGAADYLMGTLISAVTGMRAAPSKPPESMSMFPFSVAWPDNGRLVSDTPGQYRNIAYLRLETHVGRVNLPTDVDAIYPFFELVSDVLLDPDNATLGGNVDTIISSNDNPINWSFGELNWADTQTIGFRWIIPVKIKRTIS